MTLAEKTAEAKKLLHRLADDHGERGIWAAWTGGKDSTLVLALWREVLAERGAGRARALSIDTGCKFPEVLIFRDELARDWDVGLTVVRPEVNLADYPVARDKAACCRDLKVGPLLSAVEELAVSCLLVGLRRDEHPSRSALGQVERFAEPPHARAYPILEFTEMDVWAFVTEHRLPHCELYAQGYRSLGCVPCTQKGGAGGERGGRHPDKEKALSALRSLGYF